MGCGSINSIQHLAIGYFIWKVITHLQKLDAVLPNATQTPPLGFQLTLSQHLWIPQSRKQHRCKLSAQFHCLLCANQNRIYPDFIEPRTSWDWILRLTCAKDIQLPQSHYIPLFQHGTCQPLDVDNLLPSHKVVLNWCSIDRKDLILSLLFWDLEFLPRFHRHFV